MISLTISFFLRYKNILLLNKNIAIAGIVSFVIGAIFTQIYAEYYDGTGRNLENSLYTLTIGYASYIPLFAYLFYRDNKKRYICPVTGKIDTRQLKQDIKKLFTAFSVSEIVFIITKTYVHFYQLETGSIEAYQAYIIAELIAWMVYFISINTILKVVRLYGMNPDPDISVHFPDQVKRC